MEKIIAEQKTTSRTSRSIAHQEGGRNQLTRFERLHTEIFETSNEASNAVAAEIANLIRSKEEKGENCVLGLATGSSPIGVYKELVRLHQQEGLSFNNVVTFNLDEYYPMDPKALQSYVRFMDENLFNHIDIDRKNINIPDGTLDQDLVSVYCAEYEQKIDTYGGLDLQILGIGRTGHIGFNEPGSHYNSLTRLVTLDYITKTDAASDFFGIDSVPRRALTMGVGTIFKAKRIILMAWGEGKSSIIHETVEGKVSDSVPATYLQNHPKTTVVLDNAAAAELVRKKTPWLVGPCVWDEDLSKKAVIWLSQKLQKPILKLTDREYNDNGMSDLVAEHGPAYNINIRMFNVLQHTITGWPGGKPGADDTYRPERAEPAHKRVVIFSPHPDDDVISMGGTFIRLVDQGHDVNVAYQTSGNIAVFDEDVVRFADFFKDFNAVYSAGNHESKRFYEEVVSNINNKEPGDIDTPVVQKIKGLIRRGEAKAACRYIGITDDKVHFMDMPFYETGLIQKQPIGEEDIQITMDLLKEIKPHQIYAAGDLSDPHGTPQGLFGGNISGSSSIKRRTLDK